MHMEPTLSKYLVRQWLNINIHLDHRVSQSAMWTILSKLGHANALPGPDTNTVNITHVDDQGNVCWN